jgi:prolyl-tRNA synthetase
LAAAISEFGDEKGLILPPKIAPIQVILIPIVFRGKEKIVFDEIGRIKDELAKQNIRFEVDAREISPGRKYYDWEVKGVPIRIEVGPRDIENKEYPLAIRFGNKKLTIKFSELKNINKMIDDIHSKMLKASGKRLTESIIFANSSKDMINAIESKKIAKVYWCGKKECYDKIAGLGEGYEGFGTSTDSKGTGKCLNCSKPSHEELFVAKSY